MSHTEPLSPPDENSPPGALVRLLGVAAIVAAALAAGSMNFPLFHVIVELVCVVASSCIFVIAWHTRRYTDNLYMLAIGCALLFMGGMSLLHALLYQGAGVISTSGSGLSERLWSASRLLLGGAVLSAPLLAARQLTHRAILAVYALAAALLTLFCLGDVTPLAGVSAGGLPLFRLVSELLVCLMLGIGGWLFHRLKGEFGRGVRRLVSWAVALMIVASCAFMAGTSERGAFSMLGHLLQLLSVLLIGQAIIRTGLVLPFELIFRDLARRENDARERETQYRAVVETQADGFLVLDADGGILEANGAYQRRSGYSLDELRRMRIHDLESRDSHRELLHRLDRVRELGTGLFRTVHRAGDGSPWKAEVNASFWPIGGGKFFLFVRDLAARNRSELLLDARLHLSDIALAGTIDDIMTYAIDTAELLSGSTIGFFHFVDDDQEHLTLQAWSTNTVRNMCSATGKGSHYPVSMAGVWVDCLRLRTPVIHNDYASLPHRRGMPDGHAAVVRELTVPVLRGERVIAVLGVGNKPSHYDQGDVELVQELASLAMDVVLRMRSEEALRRQIAYTDLLMQHSTTPTFVIDTSHRVVIWNHAMEELTGLKGADVIGTSGHWSAFYANQRRCLADVLLDGIPLAEISRMYERVAASRLIKGAVHAEGTFSFNGSSFNLIFTAACIRDEQGKVIAAIETMEDITSRVSLENQLRQAQKMESVGVLAGGIAHDFNNVLTVIGGYTAVLAMTLPPGTEQASLLDEIEASVQRASEMTRSLLSFSSRQQADLQYDDLNRIIAALKKSLARLIREDIVFTLSPSDGSLPVMVDQVQMDQVIINLVVNARDAIPEKGRITMETRSLTLECPLASGGNEVIPAGAYAVVTVSDDGMGMDDATRQMIFEPFFTTKERNKGTGLGLSVVYGIVKKHKGFISVESTVGRGTTFRVYLPLQSQRPMRLAQVRPDVPAGDGETILLVEDDRGVLDLTRLVLEKNGYHTIVARDGVEALEKFVEHHGLIDAAIVDVIMPRMNGKETVSALRRIAPELPIIMVSGYTDDIVNRSDLDSLHVGFLHKPIKPGDLLGELGERLHGSSGRA